MINEELIRSLAEQHFHGTDKFIVSVKVKPGNKIIVFIDADSNISIGDCANLSRFIESQLNREVEDFELDVSSAGLDFPLLLLRQYQKNVGREVKVIMKDGSVKTGILTGIIENGFEITETIVERKNKKKEIIKLSVTFTFEQVKETRLIINI